MSSPTQLQLPRVDIEIIDDCGLTEPRPHSFLRIHSFRLRNKHDNGHESQPYVYETLERQKFDAVVILLAHKSDAGIQICLRSSLRPSVGLRPRTGIAFPNEHTNPVLWELPAGMLEPGETGHDGLRGCAAREAWEEVGVRIAPADFQMLGPAMLPSPGVFGEKIYPLYTMLPNLERGEAPGDGSPLEAQAAIEFVPLSVALQAVRDGVITDAKSEIALRRFAELQNEV